MKKQSNEETPYRIWRDSKEAQIEDFLEGMDDMKRLELYDLLCDAYFDGQLEGARHVIKDLL
jgi:hypothetical protein